MSKEVVISKPISELTGGGRPELDALFAADLARLESCGRSARPLYRWNRICCDSDGTLVNRFLCAHLMNSEFVSSVEIVTLSAMKVAGF
jgi:hypothetical protein